MTATTTKISYGQALSEAIRMEMYRDPSVVCVGAGDWVKRSIVTRDLAGAFGPERIISIEASGRPMSVASGLAGRGHRVLCEARAEQLGPEMLGPLGEIGDTEGSVVIRVPDAGPVTGVALAPVETRLFDTAGVRVLVPTTPADAKGMVTNAIRHSGATCVLEAEALYGRADDVPEGAVLTGLTGAKLKVFGQRATVLTYGLGTLVAHDAVAEAKLDVELIDLRFLRPLDDETIVASVGRTGKVAVVEPPGCTRVGAEVAGLLLERAFEYLDAPLTRIELPAWSGSDGRLGEAGAVVAAEIDELLAY